MNSRCVVFGSCGDLSGSGAQLLRAECLCPILIFEYAVF